MNGGAPEVLGITVANAFVEWGRSATTHIMAPQHSTVTTHQYDGSRVNGGAQCHVTDIRRVSDSSSACGSDRPHTAQLLLLEARKIKQIDLTPCLARG